MSSLLLHQPYLNTVPADVFAMCETRLNEHGIRRVTESMQDLSWSFISGPPQPQRREGVPGRLFDPMPGGVGSLVKTQIPFARTSLTVTDWTEEDLRRIQAFTIFPGEGLEPIRIVQIYGYARAHSDPERMIKNESFLQKVFRECNSYGYVPTVLIGDFNIEPQYSAVISHETFTGNWVDVSKSEAESRGLPPQWTFCQRETTSRLDLCFLNGAAMHLLYDFEVWNHEHCTIPNHKMQCVSLRIGGKKQYATKIAKPFDLPDYVSLPHDDLEFLTEMVMESHESQLSTAWWNLDVDEFWSVWTKMAEEWLLEHAALSLGEEVNLSDPKFKGRGTFVLKRVAVNKKPKDLCENGDTIGGRLTAVLKLRRLLEEIKSKNRSGNNSNEINQLWRKAQGIARSECRSTCFQRIWGGDSIPNEYELQWLIHTAGSVANKRGAYLRKKRLKQYDHARESLLRLNPSKAFQFIKPDSEQPLSVLRREDGSLTANITEMDSILRKSWSQIFCKHSDDKPAPRVDTFMAQYEEYIPFAEMMAEPLTLERVRRKLSLINSAGSVGLDGWAPKDLKRLPDKVIQRLCDFYTLVEYTGYWPQALTHAAVTLIPKGEGVGALDQRPLSILSIVYRILAAARCEECNRWQEAWITGGQHGARVRHGTTDALLKITAEMEYAMLNGKKLFGAALDLSKA